MRQEANAGMEHWVNVAKFAPHNDKSGGCVLNSLQLFNVHITFAWECNYCTKNDGIYCVEMPSFSRNLKHKKVPNSVLIDFHDIFINGLRLIC